MRHTSGTGSTNHQPSLPALADLAYSLASSHRNRGVVFCSCVWSAMLHASECWSLKARDRQRLLRSERAMLRWICHTKATEHVSYASLCQRLYIPPLDVALRERRLRWFGHVKRSDAWISKAYNMVVDGPSSVGRPHKSWATTVQDDLKAWQLQETNTRDRVKWRTGVRTAAQRQTRASHGKLSYLDIK